MTKVAKIGIVALFLVGTLVGRAQAQETFPHNNGPATFSSLNGTIVVDGMEHPTIAAAVAACPSVGCVVWVPDGLNPSFSSTVTISTPVHLIIGKNTLTCTMVDPGVASGCIVVASDNVEIEGQGPTTLITQGAAANIETAIFLGAHGNIRIHGIKVDWNDANQTATASVYEGIRSQAGSHDIRIYETEFTRGGDRAIDFRGAKRVWIQKNYFHQTGLNVAGVTNRGGNSVSVDVDGTTPSTDCWLEDNLVEEQGDAFACAHGFRAHVTHNTIRGRADFGNTPLTTEAGIDISGEQGAEVSGNHLYNVAGPNLLGESLQVGGVNYVAAGQQIEGNYFSATAASLAGTDPRVVLGNQAAVTGQVENIGYVDNSHVGVRLSVTGIDDFTGKGNRFHNILSNIAAGIAVAFDQVAGSVMENFVWSGNSFSTDNATLLIATSFGANITAPDSCVITDNSTSTGVTNDLVAATSGFVRTACFVSRSNKTIGSYQSSVNSPVSVLTPFAAKSSPYTLTSSDYWINVTGTTTITVPHALINQHWVVFNSGSNTVTIQPDSGNINGAASVTRAANTGYEVTCDGTNCFAH